MIIFAAQYQTNDGIEKQVLFLRKSTAKTYCRDENKKRGFEYFELVELTVSED